MASTIRRAIARKRTISGRQASSVRGHERRPWRGDGGRGRLERVQRDGEHAHVLRVADDQRPHVLVPGRDVGQHRQRGQRRGHHRQDQLPEDLPAPGAVEQRRLLDLLGDAEEELAQEEHRERRHQEERRHDPGVGVEPAEVLDQHEVRDQREDRRDHHRRQEQEEQLVAAREAQPRERVGGHRAERDLPDRDQRAHDHAVEQRAEEVHVGRRQRAGLRELLGGGQAERLAQVQQRRVVGDQRLRARDEVRVGRERGPEHPEEREQAHEQQQAHGGPGRDLAPVDLAPGADARWRGRCRPVQRALMRDPTPPARSSRSWNAATTTSRRISATASAEA